jgi:hypothetical protein
MSRPDGGIRVGLAGVLSVYTLHANGNFLEWVGMRCFTVCLEEFLWSGWMFHERRESEGEASAFK